MKTFIVYSVLFFIIGIIFVNSPPGKEYVSAIKTLLNDEEEYSESSGFEWSKPTEQVEMEETTTPESLPANFSITITEAYSERTPMTTTTNNNIAGIMFKVRIDNIGSESKWIGAADFQLIADGTPNMSYLGLSKGNEPFLHPSMELPPGTHIEGWLGFEAPAVSEFLLHYKGQNIPISIGEVPENDDLGGIQKIEVPFNPPIVQSISY